MIGKKWHNIYIFAAAIFHSGERVMARPSFLFFNSTKSSYDHCGSEYAISGKFSQGRNMLFPYLSISPRLFDLTAILNQNRNILLSAEDIIDAGSAFQSLYNGVWEETALVNVSSRIWHLKCHWMLIPTAPIGGLKVITRYASSAFQNFE